MEEKQNIGVAGIARNPEIKPTPAAKAEEKRLFVLTSSPHFKSTGNVSMKRSGCLS